MSQPQNSYESSRLYRIRHSAAHLMAQAVTELFPGAKLSIGPPVENGFYYDIEFAEPLQEADLAKIEARMKELAKLDQRIESIDPGSPAKAFGYYLSEVEPEAYPPFSKPVSIRREELESLAAQLRDRDLDLTEVPIFLGTLWPDEGPFVEGESSEREQWQSLLLQEPKHLWSNESGTRNLVLARLISLPAATWLVRACASIHSEFPDTDLEEDFLTSALRALARYENRNGPKGLSYKLNLLLDAFVKIGDAPGGAITFYEQKRVDRAGVSHRFVDLCRGPHVESTKELRSVKLLSIAGAYWRGNVENKQLTRIYGTAFETAEELEAYLHNIEEALKRDHRRLGKELGLFMFSPLVGTGLPLWLPKGTTLRETMIAFLRDEQIKRGYEPVTTPVIANIKLFEVSGHTINYRDKLFPFMEDEDRETYVLKPVNCPFHIEIYKSQMRSYRDLPVRYAEFGNVYRYEQSGEVTGILRARGFTQDDSHLFVTEDQLQDEFIGVVELMKSVLTKLGLTDYRARLGTRDPKSDKYIGHDDNWRVSEQAIRDACQTLGIDYEESPGDAAFYGPKLDLIIKDALGRDWQMGTVQVDYNLPERFELEYIGEDGKPHRPIMIHRAPFGSLERMIGLLTEQYAGAFPFWLAPVQVAILPIADRHNDRAHEIGKYLRDDLRYRVHVDDRRETLGKKIRENQMQKIPYMIILGDKDMESGTVGVRSYGEGDLGSMQLEEFEVRIAGER